MSMREYTYIKKGKFLKYLLSLKMKKFFNKI
jgi:hypothetical protein